MFGNVEAEAYCDERDLLNYLKGQDAKAGRLRGWFGAKEVFRNPSLFGNVPQARRWFRPADGSRGFYVFEGEA